MGKKISKVFNFVGSMLNNTLKDHALRQLINQAFSEKPSTRVLARAKLKEKYPDVWAEIQKEEKASGHP